MSWYKTTDNEHMNNDQITKDYVYSDWNKRIISKTTPIDNHNDGMNKT